MVWSVVISRHVYCTQGATRLETSSGLFSVDEVPGAAANFAHKTLDDATRDRRLHAHPLGHAIFLTPIVAGIIVQVPFRPSVVVYTILLRIYGAAGKLDLAEELLLEMEAEDCDLDDVAYSSMLQVYGHSGKYDKMLDTYIRMRQDGYLPSVTIFTTMIYHMYKASRLSDAIILWEQLLEAGLPPLYHTYTLIINCLRRVQQDEEAVKVFLRMTAEGLEPDEILYNMAITMMCKLDRYWQKQVCMHFQEL